jgi:hypothetical protein
VRTCVLYYRVAECALSPGQPEHRSPSASRSQVRSRSSRPASNSSRHGQRVARVRRGAPSPSAQRNPNNRHRRVAPLPQVSSAQWLGGLYGSFAKVTVLLFWVHLAMRAGGGAISPCCDRVVLKWTVGTTAFCAQLPESYAL